MQWKWVKFGHAGWPRELAEDKVCGGASRWPGSTEVESGSRAPSGDTGRVVSNQKGGHGMTQATFPLARGIPL